MNETIISSVKHFLTKEVLPADVNIEYVKQPKANEFAFKFGYRGQTYLGSYTPRDNDLGVAFHTVEGEHWINFSSTLKWNEVEKLKKEIPEYYLPTRYY